MTRFQGVLALSLIVAAPLAAQDPAIAAKMTGVQGDGSPKACSLDPDHFLVSSGATYLQGAIKKSEPSVRARMLRDGQRVLTQAITQSAQAKNPAAWYYLGRVDMLLGDLAGADSSLARVTELRPDCTTEVFKVRSEGVRLLAIPGNEFQRAGQVDSALYYLRASRHLDTANAFVNYEMGEAFKGLNQTDSATAYFERAIASPHDSTPNAMRIQSNSAFALGAIYYNARRFPDAVRAFRAAVAADPKDQDARKDLALSFRAAGMTDSAKALDDQMLKEAQASGTVTPDQLFDLGVAQFNDKRYADAAVSFQKVLATDPDRHDALKNLANVYFAMDSSKALVAAAERLLALEPMNYGGVKLLANGYKDIEAKLRQKPKTLEAFNRLLGMTVGLEATGFAPTADGATVKLTATGRPGADPRGNPLKPAGASIVVEFTDSTGKVVASQPATVPALAPDSTQDVVVSAKGQGIKGWRYHRS